MTDGEVEVLGPHFRWTIPRYFLNREAFSLRSPDFKYGDSTWHFRLYPNACKPKGWISLYLRKIGSALEEDIILTFSIEANDGKHYNSTVCKNRVNSHEMRLYYFLSRSKFMEDILKISRFGEGDLTLLCTLSFDKSVETAATLTTTASISLSSDENLSEEASDEEDSDNEDSPIPKGIERTLQNLKALLLSKENTDVTLNVKGREFQAHKLILGAQSSVFESMFKHDTVEKSSGVVDITDCDPDAFEDFLLYLYSGQVEQMTTSSVHGLYTIADKYDVTELKQECVQFMITEISVETFCDFVALSLRHNESELLETGTAYFMINAKRISLTAPWLTFVKENPVSAIELYIKALDQANL